MAKELTFQQRLRERGAVDGDEGAVAQRAVVVDGLRHELLSRAALPANQHRTGGVGNSADEGKDLLHGFTRADQIAERGLPLQLELQ